MGESKSLNTNRFGPHSAGVRALGQSIRRLSAEDWRRAVEVDAQGEKEAVLAVIELLGSAPSAPRSAVEAASDRLIADIKQDVKAAAGLLAAVGLKVIVPVAAKAIAFPEKLDEEQFDVAVAPFAAVGIDCRALLQMGLVEG